MRRAHAACAVAAAIALAGCAGGGGTRSADTRPPPPAAPVRTLPAASRSVCPPRGHTLDGVYHPDRLAVLGSCVAARGVVDRTRVEQDGDVHFDVRLDAGFNALLSRGNYTKQSGDLVVELMPRDGGHLPAPSAGDRVALVGAWVDDTEHEWNELHPVWSISIDGGPAHTSGPRFGGSAASDRSGDAAADCRTRGGALCAGYGAPPPAAPTAPPPAPTSFCATHGCIPSFDEGHGTIVQCADGMWSHSGGEPGACSRHGGVR